MSKSYSVDYKNAYKGTWRRAAEKEDYVARQIHLNTGRKVIAEGFGAGSAEYIEGSSGEAGFEKAAPDLQISGTDICVEVTGPLQRMDMDDDLFVNVSKVKYAFKHPEREYWVAHCNGLPRRRADVRMIRVGTMFADGIAAHEIIREQFISKYDTMQFFHVVPPDHPVVVPFDRFLLYIRSIENA